MIDPIYSPNPARYIGTSSVEQLADNLKVFHSQPFTPEQLARIDAYGIGSIPS